jgi:hypothetical protein
MKRGSNKTPVLISIEIMKLLLFKVGVMVASGCREVCLFEDFENNLTYKSVEVYNLRTGKWTQRAGKLNVCVYIYICMCVCVFVTVSNNFDVKPFLLKSLDVSWSQSHKTFRHKFTHSGAQTRDDVQKVHSRFARPRFCLIVAVGTTGARRPHCYK